MGSCESDALEHAEAGAQHRRQGDVLAVEPVDLDLAGPALDRAALGLEVTAGLVGQKRRELAGDLAKERRVGLRRRAGSPTLCRING